MMLSFTEIFGGGPSIKGGGQKIGKKGGFAAPKALRIFFEHFFRNSKVFSTFFDVFGKFVNKNAIKSDFWGVVDRYISKNSRFWENTPTNFQKF